MIQAKHKILIGGILALDNVNFSQTWTKSIQRLQR